jgi:2'-5' RNA ligase
MLRLFAALPLPPEIADGLSRRQIGVAGARWSPPENFHITLRFFGDLDEPSAEALDEALSLIVWRPLSLTLEGVGVFGEGWDIHAVWAGVKPDAQLIRLAQACDRAARKTGLKSEARAYKPHVTLAYLKRPDPAELGVWLQRHNLLQSPPFLATEFCLYASHSTKHGSRYQLERRYPAQ